MLGIIKDEDCLIIEFNPIFATTTPKWLRIKIKLSNSNYGEYGIAWSNPYSKFSLPNVWIMWGNSTYPNFAWFFKDFIKNIKR